MTTWLVAGAAGFIGCNFVRTALAADPALRVVSLDSLTYAGGEENLAPVMSDRRHEFVRGDIADRELVAGLLARHAVSAVVNFAAETHVDRSIDDPSPFVVTNVQGTFALLEAVRAYWSALVAPARAAFRLVQISTDEVYGQLGPTGTFREDSPTRPRNPYSATKAAGDHLALAYAATYGLPALVSRCSNNYGPYQLPEKLLPKVLLNALDGVALPVYGDGGNVREWLHVDDHCAAVRALIAGGRVGEVYNVGGGEELTTLEVVRAVCRALDERRPAAEPYERLIEMVPDRPGHDRRYAIDCSKLTGELGWRPAIGFAEGLARTVDWYLGQADWCAGRRRHRERLGLGRGGSR